MSESNSFRNAKIKNPTTISKEDQPQNYNNLSNSSNYKNENLKNNNITEVEIPKTFFILPEILRSDTNNFDQNNNFEKRFCEQEVSQVVIENGFDYYDVNNENIIGDEDEELVVEILDDEKNVESIAPYDKKSKNNLLKSNEDKLSDINRDDYFYNINLIPNQEIFVYMFNVNEESYTPIFGNNASLTPVYPKFAEKYLLPWTQGNIFQIPPNQINPNINPNDLNNSFNLFNTTNNISDNNISININNNNTKTNPNNITKKKENKESKQALTKKEKLNRKLMNKLTPENKFKLFKENSDVYNQYHKFFTKFKTVNYYLDEKGHKKKQKKKRKFKPDDIRKKIKSRFHKTIKNIINENLKKAGSQKLFDFLPQCFVCNISKKANQEVLNLTYKELLEKDFLINIDESKYKNKSVDIQKYQRNKEVLRYLEENPEICKKSGFDLIKDRKYSDILNIYFLSDQFDNSLKQLENEKESKEYISEYIIRAKNYVKFFSQEDKKAEKNNEDED